MLHRLPNHIVYQSGRSSIRSNLTCSKSLFRAISAREKIHPSRICKSILYIYYIAMYFFSLSLSLCKVCIIAKVICKVAPMSFVIEEFAWKWETAQKIRSILIILNIVSYILKFKVLIFPDCVFLMLSNVSFKSVRKVLNSFKNYSIILFFSTELVVSIYSPFLSNV